MVYTLSKLLSMIDSRYGSAFTTAQKVDFINEGISQVYKDIATVASVLVPLVEDESIYDLPSGVVPKSIISVTLCHVDYTTASEEYIGKEVTLNPAATGEVLRQNTWRIIADDKISFYPIPRESLEYVVRIYYRVRPVELTTSDTAKDLADYILVDYITSIIYYTLYVMSEANDDIVKANNYASRYNAEVMRLRMEKHVNQGKFPATKIVDRQHGGKFSRYYPRGRFKNQ